MNDKINLFPTYILYHISYNIFFMLHIICFVLYIIYYICYMLYSVHDILYFKSKFKLNTPYIFYIRKFMIKDALCFVSQDSKMFRTLARTFNFN